MVRTGHGVEEFKSNEIECDYVANDLYDAVQHILYLSGKRHVRFSEGGLESKGYIEEP